MIGMGDESEEYERSEKKMALMFRIALDPSEFLKIFFTILSDSRKACLTYEKSFCCLCYHLKILILGF